MIMNHIAPEILWPPHYKVKKHRRARHVKLRTTKLNGLEITVPYRFNLKEIPFILEENRIWITRQILNWQASQEIKLPDHIAVHALEKSWSVHYVPCDAKIDLIERPNREIALVGRVEDKELCRKKLIVWLKHQSKTHLIPKLESISEKIKLDFSSVRVRDQQTLWGSCTVNKSINLNYKLLFLPPSLVTHVMIHELCHTVYLNHSEKFWALVAAHDSSWHEHKLALRRADQFIPGWIQ